MIRLSRDAHGRLLLHEDAGERDGGRDGRVDPAGQAGQAGHADRADRAGVPVVPVRAFPLSAPDDGVALVGADGHERAWIDRLDRLPPADRGLLEQELAQREFMPWIERIVAVSGWLTPCTWTVVTDRGEAKLLLKSEEAIRRLANGGLLIGDSRGFAYRIRDVSVLDPQSRRLLDHFL
ncbi:MAG: DUF1854 domain-containing protein [Lautropia sp.]